MDTSSHLDTPQMMIFVISLLVIACEKQTNLSLPKKVNSAKVFIINFDSSPFLVMPKISFARYNSENSSVVLENIENWLDQKKGKLLET